MKKDFESLYSEIKNANDLEIKDAWKKADKEKKRNRTIYLIAWLIISILAFRNMKSEEFFLRIAISIMVGMMYSVFVWVVASIIFSKNQRIYKKLCKEKVVTKLIGNFYEDFKYFPEEALPKEIYNEAKYNAYYNRYRADDYFSSKIDSKYDIQFANLDIKKVTGSGKNRRTVTIFDGLFAKVNLNKNVIDELRIKTNGSTLFQKKLQMDSQEFEKYFDIVSSNDIKTMQILTHDIMSELVRFRKESDIVFDISIVNSFMYLRFSTGDMFEDFSQKNNEFDKEPLKWYYKILDFTYNVSKLMADTINKTPI